MRPRLIFLTLAVWMAVALFAPSASAYRISSWTQTSAMQELREGVRWQRSQTWKWQDAAGVARTPATFSERRATSSGYLRWLVTFWNARRVRAVAYAKAHPDPRSSTDSCTAAIVDRENPSWDPGRWNRQGSGAFGLPQAKPYWKMPKAAWPREFGGREDPYVQLDWMERYETGRYGSPCAALAFWRSNSWY